MARGGMEVGAARLDITPALPCMLSGYAARSHPHTAVHDPISVRALFARDGAGREAVLVVADIIWYGEEAADRARGEISCELGLPRSRVLVAGTHTHSAPSPGSRVLRAFEKPGVPSANAEWVGRLVARSVAAAALARLRLRPARVRIGRGSSMIGINRRERRPDGRIVLGRNPGGVCDREVVGAAFDGLDGRPIARLGNFGCHGVVLGQESYRLSGDWPGLAARMIEKRHGGAPFLFLQGGAGNVNPRIGPQNSFAPAIALAAEFARDFAAVERRWAAASKGRVDGVVKTLRMPRKDRGSKPVEIHRLDLGPVRIVSYPGEAFAETAMGVKGAARGRTVMFSSCADAGDRGYVPVREVFRDGGYEIDVTPYGPGAEETLRRALSALARGR